MLLSAAACAMSFNVQVPMSSSATQSSQWGKAPQSSFSSCNRMVTTTSYSASSGMTTTSSYRPSSSMMPSGHFSTNVASVDANGHAYAPGQYNSSFQPRRAKMDERDDPDNPPDPYINTPVGDTPYYLFALLAAAYIAYKHFRKQTA